MGTAKMTRRKAAPAPVAAKTASAPAAKHNAAMARAINGILSSLKGIKGIKAETTKLEGLRQLECASTGLQKIDDWLTGAVDDATYKIKKGTGRGFPRGRFVEIFGPESSGKTTLVLATIAAAQKRGELCAFIDAEHALDLGYARKLGVDVEALLVVVPEHGEAALEALEKLMEKCAVIGVDSIDALVPKKALQKKKDGEGAGFGGDQAKMLSGFCRKYTPKAAQYNCLVMWTNQIRMKIGVMFGNPETTSGGNAMKFYASQRIDIRTIGKVMKDKAPIGIRSRVKLVKNKVAETCYREVVYDMIFGKGISFPSDDQIKADKEAARARWQSGKKK